ILIARRSPAFLSLGRVLGLAMWAVVAPSCASLPSIQANVCGNGVIESGEDCDSAASKGTRCRAQDEVSSCRFDCSEGTDCPKGFLCGAGDSVCRAPSG